MFPKLRKRSPQGSSESASDKEDDEATDYVFRIIYPGTQSEFGECVGRECLGWVVSGCMSRQRRSSDRHIAICASEWFQRNELSLYYLLFNFMYGLGFYFFHFNLSLATESFISAVTQQTMTALIAEKKILAHKVHFGHLGVTFHYHKPGDSSLAMTRPTQQVLH